MDNDTLAQVWYLTEAMEAIASVAPGLCLGALSKVPIEIYKFLIEVSFAKEKSPCPFKYESIYYYYICPSVMHRFVKMDNDTLACIRVKVWSACYMYGTSVVHCRLQCTLLFKLKFTVAYKKKLSPDIVARVFVQDIGYL